MTEVPQGIDWWQATDGRWYPPELRQGKSDQPPIDTSSATSEEADSPEIAPKRQETTREERLAWEKPASLGAAPKRPAAAQRRGALMQPAASDSDEADLPESETTKTPSVETGQNPAMGDTSFMGDQKTGEPQPLLLELRGSRLTSDIDRIGDRLEITDDGVVQRGRGNKERAVLEMSEIAMVEVEKTHKGFWLRIRSVDGSEILQQGLEQETAENGSALLRSRAPLAARAAEEAAARAEAVMAEIAAARSAARHASEPEIQSTPSAPQAPSQTADIPDQIRKLADLRDSGILDEDEFQKKKRELLDRL